MEGQSKRAFNTLRARVRCIRTLKSA